VARRLAGARGVLEQMQTATTVKGQVEELRAALKARADPPVVLVGHSWGAWLSCILAAKYPRLVRKLVLVGSGPFEEKYVPLLRDNRLLRLTVSEREEFRTLAELLARLAADVPAGSLQRLERVLARGGMTDVDERRRTAREALEGCGSI
jgi:pimeloyl-ACP methyl ester carboxylesterase